MVREGPPGGAWHGAVAEKGGDRGSYPYTIVLYGSLLYTPLREMGIRMVRGWLVVYSDGRRLCTLGLGRWGLSLFGGASSEQGSIFPGIIPGF